MRAAQGAARRSSAKGLADGYSPFEIGTGRVDVAAAVKDTVRGTGSLFFGNFLWPHGGANEVPVTHDLTFTNDGASDVTLDLTNNATGGAITLGASTVTVPAGGQATVPVTGDPQAAAIGRDAGWIVGTDEATGKAVTRTSVALVKEDERYDLNVSLVGRDGNPAAAWVTVNLAGDPFGTFPVFVTGQKTLRLPPGDYSVTTYLDDKGEQADRSGLDVLVLAGHGAGPLGRRRAGRAQRPSAPDHGSPTGHRGPAAQGGPGHRRPDDGAGVP